MLSTLIGFYIAQALQPILSINTTKDIPLVEESSFRINKLDFSSLITVNPLPLKRAEFISPVIQAVSSIAMDNQTGGILYEKNASSPRQIASITKLMTAAIILEENDLNSIITVSKEVAATDGSNMSLRMGEKISVENLLYGLIINSANDAAITLAEFNAGTEDKFVEKMNRKAEELNLSNTHFQNAIGYDNKYNYSTALDIAKLSRYIYQKQFIKKSAAIKEMEVKSTDGKHTHRLKSTNNLLDSYLKIKGLKTGHTEKAGLCMVAIAENDKGNDIITVVLGSPARFQESKALIDWTFRAYIW